MYPEVEEELIDFLNCYKLKGSEVMVCPCCSVIFDKEAIKDLKSVRPKQPKRNNWSDRRPQFSFDKRGDPYKKIPRAYK